MVKVLKLPPYRLGAVNFDGSVAVTSKDWSRRPLRFLDASGSTPGYPGGGRGFGVPGFVPSLSKAVATRANDAAFDLARAAVGAQLAAIGAGFGLGPTTPGGQYALGWGSIYESVDTSLVPGGVIVVHPEKLLPAETLFVHVLRATGAGAGRYGPPFGADALTGDLDVTRRVFQASTRAAWRIYYVADLPDPAQNALVKQQNQSAVAAASAYNVSMREYAIYNAAAIAADVVSDVNAFFGF